MRVLGAAVLLLLVSRLPFLTANVDWGVFHPEHLWIITDAAAVARSAALDEGTPATLGELDLGLYAIHYHAGGRWVTEAVRWLGVLTGGFGVLQMKLLGLLGSLIALCGYTVGVMRLWPGDARRWWLPVGMVWLFPPTLFLWMTLVPMGHYMETWFFHGLFLPLYATMLADRATTRHWLLAGLLGGVATAYVLTTAVLPGLLAVGWLLITRHDVRQRAISLGAMALAFLAVWLPTGGVRYYSVMMWADEFLEDPGERGGVVVTVGEALVRLFTNAVVVDGDGWSRRGMFALFEPANSVLGTAAAWVLALAAGAGCAYLLWHAYLFLHPGRRGELDVPGRVLALHGLMLPIGFAAYLVLITWWYHQAYVCYLTLSYPPLLFGLGAGAAAAWARWGRGAGVAAVGLLVVMAIGWGESVAFTNRAIDRPPIQRMDHGRAEALTRFALDSGDALPDPAAVSAVCERLHPQNSVFCSALGWQALANQMRAESEGVAGPQLAGRLSNVCSEAEANGNGEACALAAGGQLFEDGLCDAPMAKGLSDVCADFPEALRPSCVSGIYRGAVVDGSSLGLQCSTSRMLGLCTSGAPISTWQHRACLEGLAFFITGAPALPSAVEGSPAACEGWPPDLRGLCAHLATARPADGSTPSCEDVYRTRFVEAEPDSNELLYQQCAHLDILTGFDLYPSCAVGVLRATDAVSCSWDGSGLRL